MLIALLVTGAETRIVYSKDEDPPTEVEVDAGKKMHEIDEKALKEAQTELEHITTAEETLETETIAFAKLQEIVTDDLKLDLKLNTQCAKCAEDCATVFPKTIAELKAPKPADVCARIYEEINGDYGSFANYVENPEAHYESQVETCRKSVFGCRFIAKKHAAKQIKERKEALEKKVEDLEEKSKESDKKLKALETACVECRMKKYYPNLYRKPTAGETAMGIIKMFTPVAMAGMGLAQTVMTIDSTNTLYGKYLENCNNLGLVACATPPIYGFNNSFGAGGYFTGQPGYAGFNGMNSLFNGFYPGMGGLGAGMSYYPGFGMQPQFGMGMYPGIGGMGGTGFMNWGMGDPYWMSMLNGGPSIWGNTAALTAGYGSPMFAPGTGFNSALYPMGPMPLGGGFGYQGFPGMFDGGFGSFPYASPGMFGGLGAGMSNPFMGNGMAGYGMNFNMPGAFTGGGPFTNGFPGWGGGSAGFGGSWPMGGTGYFGGPFDGFGGGAMAGGGASYYNPLSAISAQAQSMAYQQAMLQAQITQQQKVGDAFNSLSQAQRQAVEQQMRALQAQQAYQQLQFGFGR